MHDVHRMLQVFRLAKRRCHNAAIRQDEAILAVCAVAAVAAARAVPELITVAALPICPFMRAVIGMYGRRLLHPGFGKQTASVPHSAVQIKQAELRRIVTGGMESGTALNIAVDGAVPINVSDVHITEQFEIQIVQCAHARHFFHDGGQHTGCTGVIAEMCARLIDKV